MTDAGASGLIGRAGLTAIGLSLGICPMAPSDPEWRVPFGYAEESIHRFEIRDLGFPFVPVGFGGDTVWLPFDTGNMVGLTLERRNFRGLGLPCSERWDRLDSGGQLISSGCTAHGVAATVFGTALDSISVFEFSHERLPGLVGPGAIPGNRFTVDYEAAVLAVGEDGGPDTVEGFVSIPLVRSPRRPRLIIVPGRVRGHDVLVEIDTGKSRTTMDRRLVGLLRLEETPDGVPVGRVDLGPRTWTGSTARVVDTSAISEGLPAPISLGVGSDILAGFVFTVDYAAGRLWIELPR